MSDSRGERAKKFAEMHLKARMSGGKSQEYMAVALKVSTNTVKNWEKGVSSPSFFQSRKWFQVLNTNPLPYYLSYISPYKSNGLKEPDSEKKISESFLALNEELPLATKQSLLYMFKGDHGCAKSAVVQLLLAYLHLPLRTRIIPAMSIAQRYEMDKDMDTLINKIEIMPNLDDLSEAIFKLRVSIMNTDFGVTAIEKDASPLSGDEEDEELLRFAQMHLNARTQAGVSQEYMAMELGVSKATIKNWEKGISEPTFFESIEWFRVLGKNPFACYLSFLSLYKTELVSVEKEEAVSKAFIELANELPVEAKHAILFLFYGEHGSSPFAVVQLFVAYLHTALKARLSSGITLTYIYELEYELKNIVCKDECLPDIAAMREEVLLSKAFVLRNEYGYTIIDKEIDEKIVESVLEGTVEDTTENVG